MALEAVVFSQDPLLSYCCKDVYSLGTWNYDQQYFTNYPSLLSVADDDDVKPAVPVSLSDPNINLSPSISIAPSSIPSKISEWDQYHQYVYNNSSPETCTDVQYHGQLVGPAAAGHHHEVIISDTTDGTSEAATVDACGGGGRRRKRRRGSTKNKEEVENQRMTHIAVERNRRRQMNEYLAVIKSLMPPPYVQRGDQASIIGGAINYVKELEQLLHSLESSQQKKIKKQSDNDMTSPIFADFFTFPQYSTRSITNHHLRGDNNSSSSPPLIKSSLIHHHENNTNTMNIDHATTSTNEGRYSITGGSSSSTGAAAAEIEVTMVDNHANLKILVKKQPKQLLKLVSSFQNLRFTVLHLNLTTTVDNMVLYSFSLKVEEGSQFNSVEEIAAVSNQILTKIQQESTPSV